jgi:hypothetical protein
MRILLASHLPPSSYPAGIPLGQLAAGLAAAGHQVRVMLVVGENAAPDDWPSLVVDRIVCRHADAAADVPFALPAFEPASPATQPFSQLSDRQVGLYRDRLRRRLDGAIEVFDPDLIHCQQVWLFGHLALESGAPYVMTAQGPELAALRSDGRYRRLVEQAVENAGGILAANATACNELLALFPDAADLVLPEPALAGIPAIYQAVLKRRHGRH